MIVSIGLPIFNNEATLLCAIKSIFSQTLQSWELIVIDDGSTDRSLQIAEQVRDPRVRVYTDGQNRGLPARLNQITSLAKCELLARMDADDLMHPERLAQQVTFLMKRPKIDLVGSSVFTIGPRDEILGVRGGNQLATDPATVVKKGLFVHPSVMGRKKWFKRHPYDEEFRRAQDRELWCRTIADSAVGNLKRPLLYYRESEINLIKYMDSLKADQRILARYGPKYLGFRETQSHLLYSRVKGCIYRAAWLVHGTKFLVRRRNRRVRLFEEIEAKKGLRTIHATEVPGVSCS